MLHKIEGFGFEAIIGDLSAELQSFGPQGGTSLLWHGDATYWAGRSPILFPIVGKAPDDTITVDGAPYQMAQHGFARRSTFALIEQGADFTRHRLCESDATLAQFPREFCLELTHQLTAAGLVIRAEVTNTGMRPLPFGLGFHPAFLFPLPDCEALPHIVTLANGGEPERSLLAAGLLSPSRAPSPFQNGKLEIHHTLFTEDALVFLDGAGDSFSYGVAGGPQIEFRVENLPFLALWTKPDAPFLCVEPWAGAAAFTGMGAAIEDRPGTTTLPQGESAAFSMTILPKGF